MATSMHNSMAPAAGVRRTEGCAWNPPARRGRTNPRTQRGRSRVLPTHFPQCAAAYQECTVRTRNNTCTQNQILPRSSITSTRSLIPSNAKSTSARKTPSPPKTISPPVCSTPVTVASPSRPSLAPLEVPPVVRVVEIPQAAKEIELTPKDVTQELALLNDVNTSNTLTLELCAEGVGGAYFVRDDENAVLGVFKPQDEEPGAINNPKDANPCDSHGGIEPGRGWVREIAAYKLDHGGFAGVPPTVEYSAPAQLFPKASDVSGQKTGSLQRFIRNADGGSCIASCDVGPARFPTRDVHRIGLLDLRLLNCDRHGGNMLVQKTASNDTRLVPIDHTYCLPFTLEALEFEWLFWPQSKTPFGAEEIAYVEKLDVEADLRTLRALGIEEAALDMYRAATLVVQIGVGVGCCLRALGNFMRRERLGEPSRFEKVLQECTPKDGVIDFSQLMAVLTASLTPLSSSSPPTTPPYVRAVLEQQDANGARFPSSE